MTNIGGAPEQVGDHFEVTLVGVGFLVGAIFLSQGLFQIPGGRLIDRFGPKRVGLGCLALLVGCNAAILLSTEFATVLGLRLLAGVGSGIGFLAGASHIGRLGGTALAQGVYGGVSVGSGGMAVASVAFLSDSLGWRAAFVSAAIVAGGSLLALSPVPDGKAIATSHHPGALRSLLADRRIWRFSVIQGATFGLSMLASNWLVLLLVVEKSYSRESSGAIASLILLGGVIARPAGGWLTLRRPGRQDSSVRSALVLAALTLIIVSLVDLLPVVVAAAALFGLAVGVPFGALFAGVIEARPDAPGLALAVMGTPSMFLVMAGTPLMGATFSVLGDGRIGFLIVGALLALSTCAVPRRMSSGAHCAVPEDGS